MTVGHEFYGEIVEVGNEVKGLKLGQWVSGEGHITCGFCRNCRAGKRHLCRNTLGLGVNRPGCFGEYLVFLLLMLLCFQIIFPKIKQQFWILW